MSSQQRLLQIQMKPVDFKWHSNSNSYDHVLQYTYLWNTVPPQTTQTAINIPAGTYTVTVSCIGGCTATASTTIINIAGPSITIAQTNSTCELSNGSATATASGGTTPYSYAWNSTPAQNTATMSNVPAGTYIITVTDFNGCSATNTVTITTTTIPTATTTTTNEICNRVNGTATALPNGGTGIYTYQWSTIPVQITQTASGLAAGIYFVTVSDGLCTVVANAIISNEQGPIAEFVAHPNPTNIETPVSIMDNSTGTIVNYLWDFGDGSAGTGTSNSHLYPTPGDYDVTLIVIDNNGCSDTISDTIVVKDIFAFFIPNALTPDGDGKNETWYPSGNYVDPNNYDCKIFDRWGKMLFHTTLWNVNKGEAWSGTYKNSTDRDKVEIGVYVYRIVVKELSGPKHEYMGSITVVH